MKQKNVTPKPNSHTILAPYIRPFAIRNQKKNNQICLPHTTNTYTVPSTAHHSHTQQSILLNQPKFTTNTWPTDFNQQNHTPNTPLIQQYAILGHTGPHNTQHSSTFVHSALCDASFHSTAQHHPSKHTHNTHNTQSFLFSTHSMGTSKHR